ncbi:hypothetical protein [Nannocystis sp. SCPEA4]|uniref:hypothetical protein n=1 Tax=Nannocystis sp. SCPEA4 TaxID=2996787 RepID=UPI002271BBB4|nr:hypothetical protein [Nannocystis sp. SCPEA4]MCY1058642.1 hypothetical protein [Nannocystis sp. SCPEA4]
MTPSFAVVAEGPSDFLVLNQILAGYFANPNIVVNQLQPAVDATSGSSSPGGWFEVFRYLRSEKLAGAFAHNDYVVIHIDTDVCEEPHFGVPRRRPDGTEYTTEELHDFTVARLIREIEPEVFARFQARFIFAVAVDSIECWLLPLYYTDSRRAKTTNCLNTLNSAISAREGFSIDVEKKQVKYYRKIVKALGKRKELDAHSRHNASFQRFLGALERVRASQPSSASPDA